MHEEEIRTTLADRIADRMDEQEIAALVRSTLLKQGPVVLTFFRGAWCANSNLRLRAYQEILPHTQVLGAHAPLAKDTSLSTPE